MDRRRSSVIVPEIYRATVDSSHWDYVLESVAKLTCSKTACLYHLDKNKLVQLATKDLERINLIKQGDADRRAN